MLDVSAFAGNWPFRKLPHADPESLEARLRREGFTEALVSPLDALFHTDPRLANEALREHLARLPFFRFVPILCPTLPNPERALEAARAHGAAAIRLLPNYHGYAADCDPAVEMARAAGAAHMPVIMQLRMQDARAMHPLAQVLPVDWKEAVRLARRAPQTSFLLAGAHWGEAHSIRTETPDLSNLFLETSHMEWIDGLRRFLDQWGCGRLLIGTHAPLFTPTAARLKLETARLSDEERRALASENARLLLSAEY